MFWAMKKKCRLKRMESREMCVFFIVKSTNFAKKIGNFRPNKFRTYKIGRKKNVMKFWAMKKKWRLKERNQEKCVFFKIVISTNFAKKKFGKFRPNLGHTKLGGKKNVVFWAMEKRRLKERNPTGKGREGRKQGGRR
jgi:hypothetical protein